MVGCAIVGGFAGGGLGGGVKRVVLRRSAFGRRGAQHLAMITLLMTAIGVGWGISWVTWASDYSRFVPRTVSSTAVFWYSYVGMFVPTVWLALLGATVASRTLATDPAQMVSRVFGRVTGLPGS